MEEDKGNTIKFCNNKSDFSPIRSMQRSMILFEMKKRIDILQVLKFVVIRHEENDRKSFKVRIEKSCVR